MKKIIFLLLILCAFILSSCMALVVGTALVSQKKGLEYYNDDFKNSQTIILEQRIDPEENDPFRGYKIKTANLTYIKSISDNFDEVNIYFVISRDPQSFGVGEEAYARINGINYNLILNGEKVGEQSHYNTTTITKTDENSTKTETNTVLEEKFFIRLSPEMINSIKQTDEIIFRFYFGPNQATYIVQGAKLRMAKKFLI